MFERMLKITLNRLLLAKLYAAGKCGLALLACRADLGLLVLLGVEQVCR